MEFLIKIIFVLVKCIEITCMKACFDQESCMSNHSPQDTNCQTTAVAQLSAWDCPPRKLGEPQMENAVLGNITEWHLYFTNFYLIYFNLCWSEHGNNQRRCSEPRSRLESLNVDSFEGLRRRQNILMLRLHSTWKDIPAVLIKSEDFLVNLLPFKLSLSSLNSGECHNHESRGCITPRNPKSSVLNYW